MKHPLFIALLFSVPFLATAQTATQTVRGRVVDAESGYPIFAASVQLVQGGTTGVGTTPAIGGDTDDEGRFTLNNVPLGKQVVSVSALGYEMYITAPFEVISGKEVVLELGMRPSVKELDAVKVKARGDRTRANNDMAVISARSFDAELAQRFAWDLQSAEVDHALLAVLQRAPVRTLRQALKAHVTR